jgi:pimeloyl-ACP methyl ester carboxylesterase
MSVVRRNNVTLSGRPSGRPVLFAHGFGCDQNMWRFMAPAFADDHRIVLFDHVGAGRSDLSADDEPLLAVELPPPPALGHAVGVEDHRVPHLQVDRGVDERRVLEHVGGVAVERCVRVRARRADGAAAAAEGIVEDVVAFQEGVPRDDIAVVVLAVPQGR